MIIKELTVGLIMANCFIVGCEETKESIVIDPGGDVDKILMSLAEENLKIKYIVNTHGHVDHVAGNKAMKEATGADILIHPLDEPMLSQVSATAATFGFSAEDSPPADGKLEDGGLISFGNIALKVIHTPGHSLGGVSLFVDGSVFVGDTLFAGSIGRTDFPGGDYDILISSIRNKLFVLGDDVKVFPGHMGMTTIGQEKRFNPFAGIS